MRRILLIALLVALSSIAHAQSGPYKILQTVKVGGEGGFDYLTADSANRRLYIARSGAPGRLTIFDLDTLALAGEIPNVSAHGAVIDHATNHGFATSNPIAMFDAKAATLLKTIAVQGSPDGFLDDDANRRVYIFSHRAPNVTVLDAATGNILSTIDLGGGPEQAVTDGHGHIYVDLEDKGAIAVIDANSMKLEKTYSLQGKGDGCAGLAFDAKNGILFAACREPQVMVILRASDGRILTTLPIGDGCDGAVFNPDTKEAFSAQSDGTLTVIKENSPTSFTVEQTVQTPLRARTVALDTKTNHLILVTAKYGPTPAPAPGTPATGRHPRPPMLPDSFTILVVGK